MKALRFLGIAVLACSMMFVSCTKKYTITVKSNNTELGTVTGGGTYEEGKTVTLTATPTDLGVFKQWNDGITSRTREVKVVANVTLTAEFVEKGTPAPTTEGVAITFNNNTWAANGMDAVAQSGYNTYYIWKTYQDQTDVYLLGFMLTTPGDYDYESSEGDYFAYRDQSYIYTDTEGKFGEVGAQYYGWTAAQNTFVEHIVSVDLNTCKITANFSEEIADMANITLDEEGYVADWGQTKPLLGVMVNASWTYQQSSKNAAKKSAKARPFVAVK